MAQRSFTVEAMDIDGAIAKGEKRIGKRAVRALDLQVAQSAE